ncbi:MAG: PAS domain S-box protein [Rubrivivax sp.]|nr:PAS domain S-box protein [Rubrivivax sp.]
MRVNLPVVDSEYPFPEGALVVSTTDPQGRILYGNAAFVEVSGFKRAELLGQPHNILRHPDMPAEAFRDMWATLAQGRPWTGIVKNRRKDGRHYWVKANVTPIFEGARISGYLSVRTQPERATVQAVEQLYATMRAEAEQGRLVHRVQSGAVWRDTWGSRVLRACRLGVTARLAALAGLPGLGTAALGAWAGWPGPALLAAVAAGAVFSAAAVALGLRRWVHQPLEALLPQANRLAAGDLTQSIHIDGEGLVADVALALGQAGVNMRAVVGDALRETAQMQRATSEIASGNQNLASRTESQAASLEQTAASIHQITDTVRHCASDAGEARQLAARACDTTRHSAQAMQAMSATMSGIAQSSARIGEIIGVIDSIAFQTNILALNAAVEAARAGEQGRGFAVVAAEVRALAQRTTGAARQVKDLISASAAQVAAGHQQSDAARQTMAEVKAAVQQVSAVIESIANGAREQLSSFSEVNEAISQIEEITQRNAGLVQQVAASAQELDRQAGSVSQAMQVFTLGPRRLALPDAVSLRKAARAEAKV